MFKHYLFIFLVILSLTLVSAKLSDDYKDNKIKDNEIIKSNLTLDNIKYASKDKTLKLMDDKQTINIKEDNTGFVLKNEKEINIYGFNAKSKENIIIETYSINTDPCFIFNVNSGLVTVNKILKNGINIKNKEIKQGNKICYENVNSTNATYVYSLDYYGTNTIKYNVEFDNIVLDPYIIGSLGIDTSLGLNIPFNGNLSNIWSSTNAVFSSAYSKWYDAYTYTSIHCNNYGNGVDSNYGTAVDCVCEGGEGGVFDTYHYFNKSNSTGAILESYDSYSGKHNVTISDACFNYNTTHIKTRTVLYASCAPAVDILRQYCYDKNGVEYQIYSTGDISTPRPITFYDDYMYFSQVGAYTAFINPIVYVNAYTHTNVSTSVLYGNDVQGMLNKSVYLNGTQWLNITNISLANLSNSRGFSVWLKPEILTTNEVIFNYGKYANEQMFYLVLNSSGNLILSDGTTSYINAPNIFTVNEWVHVAVTFNGNTTRLFKNGINIASNSNSALLTQDSQIVIGRDMGNNSNYYKGHIDELLFYNRYLSDSEIKRLYAGYNLTGHIDLTFRNNTDAVITWDNTTNNSNSYGVGFTGSYYELVNLMGTGITTIMFNKDVNKYNQKWSYYQNGTISQDLYFDYIIPDLLQTVIVTSTTGSIDSVYVSAEKIGVDNYGNMTWLPVYNELTNPDGEAVILLQSQNTYKICSYKDGFAKTCIQQFIPPNSVNKIYLKLETTSLTSGSYYLSTNCTTVLNITTNCAWTIISENFVDDIIYKFNNGTHQSNVTTKQGITVTKDITKNESVIIDIISKNITINYTMNDYTNNWTFIGYTKYGILGNATGNIYYNESTTVESSILSPIQIIKADKVIYIWTCVWLLILSILIGLIITQYFQEKGILGTAVALSIFATSGLYLLWIPAVPIWIWYGFKKALEANILQRG